MYLTAVGLYAIPGLPILLPWKQMTEIRSDSLLLKWRLRCLIASLMAAGVGVAAGFAEITTWLHSGGNPNGKQLLVCGYLYVGYSFPPLNWTLTRQEFYPFKY
jgi:hypothetical protein